MRPLLEQALHVSPQTRRMWLKNLSKARQEKLQAEIAARFSELGTAPPTAKAAAPTTPKVSDDRLNSIRSGSLIGTQRAIRVGRHVVMIPAAADYRRTRDTLCYVYFRGVVSGYAAKGAKLAKLKLDAATRAHIARSLFNVKT